MASSSSVRNFANNRLRNSRNNIERARTRFESNANNVATWWKDGAVAIFNEGKSSTLRDANDLLGDMATMQSRFANLAEQIRRAEDERREARRNR